MRALGALAIVLPLLTNSGEAAEEANRPLVALSGADSRIRQASYRRVTSSDDWAQIWASHLGTSVDDAYRQRFEVDFERCIVVVIFRGEQRNSRGIRIDSAENTGESIVVRFTELGYQTAGASNDQPPDRPYAFIVLPATAKTIVFEENFPTKQGTAPAWKEVARLDGNEFTAGQH